jgi:hypothetical protein
LLPVPGNTFSRLISFLEIEPSIIFLPFPGERREPFILLTAATE